MPRMTQSDYLAFLARHNQLGAAKLGSSVAGHDPESKFHEEILAWLKRIPIHGVVHSRMDRKSTVQVGVPDFLFAYQGVPIALEAKVKGRKPTTEQLGWLTALQMDGWVTGVVRSLHDVMDVLNRAKDKVL